MCRSQWLITLSLSSILKNISLKRWSSMLKVRFWLNLAANSKSHMTCLSRWGPAQTLEMIKSVSTTTARSRWCWVNSRTPPFKLFLWFARTIWGNWEIYRKIRSTKRGSDSKTSKLVKLLTTRRLRRLLCQRDGRKLPRTMSTRMETPRLGMSSFTWLADFTVK